MSGYADDTAVYLRDRTGVTQVVSVMDEFAAVSGLATNRSTSTFIELDPRGSNLPIDARFYASGPKCKLPILGGYGRTARYIN